MYRVEWMRKALDEVARLGETDDESLMAEIRSALHDAKGWLSSRPFAVGESRSDQERIAFFPPLAVEYFVVPDAYLVTIFRVRLYQPKK